MEVEIKNVFRCIVSPTLNGWQIEKFQTGSAAYGAKIAAALNEVEPIGKPGYQFAFTFSYFEGTEIAELINRAKSRSKAILIYETDQLILLQSRNLL